MYRTVFSIVGVFAAGLGLLLLVVPKVYLQLYLLAPEAQSTFAAQRLAPALIGLGALLWLARDLPKGLFAARFAGLVGVVWLGVAATGVYHYVTGMAGGNILAAAAVEVVLGMVFLTVARSARDETPEVC